MAFFCEGLCCQHSFKDFNRIFQDGVPQSIAALVTPARLSSGTPDKLYDLDMSQFDSAAINHFERDWLGMGGTPWFSAEAGKLVYTAVVEALQTAGSRQIKAIWVESKAVSVQTIEDERLVLILVGSPRPAGDGKIHSGGVCGVCATA
jgi:hypothetical protein